MAVPITHKVCCYTGCLHAGMLQPISNFHLLRTRGDGFQPQCKQCGQRKYYANAQHHRSRATLDREKYPAYYMLAGAKRRAKINQLPIDITESFLEDLISRTKICPVYGITLLYGQARAPKRDSAASLDRIIPENGYVMSNVRIISDLANKHKSSALPIHQLLQLLDCARLNTPWDPVILALEAYLFRVQSAQGLQEE